MPCGKPRGSWRRPSNTSASRGGARGALPNSGRGSPRQTSGCAIHGVGTGFSPIPAILGFIAVPLSGNIVVRARYAKARNDIRIISAAIAGYRAHTGSSPATLADLTVAAANSQGQTAGPFLTQLPTPPCCGRLQYTY